MPARPVLSNASNAAKPGWPTPARGVGRAAVVIQQAHTVVLQRWPQCNRFISLYLDLRPQARITNALQQGAGIALEIDALQGYVKNWSGAPRSVPVARHGHQAPDPV